MLVGMIGKKSKKTKNVIERGAVRKFVEAIGDPAPIFVDELVGGNSPYGKNIAPPTFPVTFNGGTIPELNLPDNGLIHGEQIYHYNRPLMVDEEIICWIEVKDYYEKTGNFGKMGFLNLILFGEDMEGALVFTEERIVIINEAVRREMKA